MKAPYSPPFTVTARMVSQIASIAEQVGRLTAAQGMAVRLRRINRIRTIQGSLAIEGNTLSEAQITAIRGGKPVIAPPREVMEARNALKAYEQLGQWQPAQEQHLLAAHNCLMQGLVDDAGRYRQGGVGVMQGDQVMHMAPPASRVLRLMRDLLGWLAKTDQHPLITSSVFHYEFEFIHPFSDGNGRMGRLWQTLMLSRWNPVMAYVPVESLVHAQQAGYYAALNASTRQSDCAVFIEFMLGCLQQAIRAASTAKPLAEVKVKTRAKAPVKKQASTPERVLAALKRTPTLTLAEVAAQLGLSTSAVERAARSLRERGRLRYVGPQKGGHWEVLP